MAKYPFTAQIYIAKEMKKAIKEAVKRTNMSKAEWLRKAIQTQLDKDRWA